MVFPSFLADITSFPCTTPSKHLFGLWLYFLFSKFFLIFEKLALLLKWHSREIIVSCSLSEIGVERVGQGPFSPLTLAQLLLFDSFSNSQQTLSNTICLPLPYTSQYAPARTLDSEFKIICMTTENITIQVQHQVIRNRGWGDRNRETGWPQELKVQPGTHTLPC